MTSDEARNVAFDEFWHRKYPKGSTQRQMRAAMSVWDAAWRVATKAKSEECAKICDKRAEQALSDEEALHYRVAAKDIRGKESK